MNKFLAQFAVAICMGFGSLLVQAQSNYEPYTFSTLAGSAPGSVNGVGSAARFNRPDRVAVDTAGNVFVADRDNHVIRKITPAGVVRTLAGLAGTEGSSDGQCTGARFIFPEGIAVDGTGNVYVAENRGIRKITPAGLSQH